MTPPRTSTSKSTGTLETQDEDRTFDPLRFETLDARVRFFKCYASKPNICERQIEYEDFARLGVRDIICSKRRANFMGREWPCIPILAYKFYNNADDCGNGIFCTFVRVKHNWVDTTAIARLTGMNQARVANPDYPQAYPGDVVGRELLGDKKLVWTNEFRFLQ